MVPDDPQPAAPTGALRALEDAAASVLRDIQRAAREAAMDPVAALEIWDDETFDRHALALFHAQRAAVPAYGAWCEHELSSRGIGPADVSSWREVPALPIAAFKRMRVAPPATGQWVDGAEWWSSGTTASGTSRHHLRDTGLYDASLAWGSRLALLPDAGELDEPLLAVQLAPTAADAPHSSLSHMLDAIRTMCADGGSWVSGEFEVDAAGAWQQLADASEDGQPVLLLATSFALVGLLDATADRPALTLPAGSRVMDTGGYKGRTRELTRDELLAAIEQRLGVPPQLCENEYGMSELSTQAWLGTVAAATGHPFPGQPSIAARWQPPWMRTRVVDPTTLRDVPNRYPGLLVHHDLANAWSCAAIRTEDMGVLRGHSYELTGRAPGAQLRGCSLQLKDVLG